MLRCFEVYIKFNVCDSHAMSKQVICGTVTNFDCFAILGASGTCVDDCGLGYYAVGQQCLACSADCLSCDGSHDHCTACKVPSFLQV